LKKNEKSDDEVAAKLSPVCGETSIEHIARNVLLSAYADGLKRPSAGAVAYHCERGHVFLLLSEDFSRDEAVPIGPGYAISL
jgi:hypothetical protein